MNNDVMTISAYRRDGNDSYQSTEITQTYHSFATLTEVLESFKAIMMGMGYQEESWNDAVTELAADIHAQDVRRENRRAQELDREWNDIRNELEYLRHDADDEDCECTRCDCEEPHPHRRSRA